MESEEFVIKRNLLAAQGKTALVWGATGETGKELTKTLLKLKIYSRLVFVGRRKIEYEDELYKDVEQIVVNFDKIEEYADSFKGFDVCYCCFGTITGKAGPDYFYKVDHNYVINTSKLIAAGGCKEFHFVSAVWANKNHFHLYPRVKGQVEEELMEMKFENLYIYRPAQLLCDRVESRLGEYLRILFFTPLFYFYPTWLCVPTKTLAEAMINRTIASVSETVPRVVVLENWELHQAAKWNNKPEITW